MNFGYPVLLGLFFLSGASSLAYQMVWSRMLGTGLGHEMPAVLAAVAAIFGGLTAGSWFADRLLGRSLRPGRWYGGLEILIGVWGLISALLLPVCNEAALKLIGLNPPAWRQWLVVFALPLLALFPATAAMGATFPAMERFLSPRVPGGRCVGALYAVNTLGAVAGVLASTWLVLPFLGFVGGLVVFSAVSLCSGVTALLLPSAQSEKIPAFEKSYLGVSKSRLVLTLWGTGLFGIGFEVLGVRGLAQVLENTVYTYALVLAIYLFGTAAGGAIYQARAQRLASAKALQGLLLGLSSACLVGVWALVYSQNVYNAARARFGATPVGVWAAELCTAGLVFLLPTLFMGATCSWLVQSAKLQAIGVGRAFALNTLGSALAPFCFGVLLLPTFGAKWSFVCVAIGYLALLPRVRGRQGWGMIVPLLLAVALPQEVRLVRLSAGEKLLAYRAGIMDSVAVVERFDGHRSLLVNSRFTMGGTGAAWAERRHGTIPLLLHPAPKRALFLGLGTGITFAAAGSHDGLNADGVELLPEIVQTLPWFEPQNSLPKDPDRFRVYTADARRFVRVCPDHYDVIVADLFHPARDGAGALYSLEHFRAIRSRLAPGGLFCQWLPLYQLDEPMLRVIIRTFLEAFPESRAFLLRFNVDTPVLGLVGTLEPVRYDSESFDNRARNSKLRAALNAEQLRDSYHFFGCFLAGPQALRALSQGASLNTDNQPVVLFGAPKLLSSSPESSYGRLLHLLDACPSDLRELVRLDSDSARVWADQLAGFIAARNIYLRGLVCEAESHNAQAIDLYLESARRSPLFPSGYAHCLTLAMQQAKADPQAARQLLERLNEAQPNRPVAAELLKRLSAP